jgi:hypothetical protein
MDRRGEGGGCLEGGEAPPSDRSAEERREREERREDVPPPPERAERVDASTSRLLPPERENGSVDGREAPLPPPLALAPPPPPPLPPPLLLLAHAHAPRLALAPLPPAAARAMALGLPGFPDLGGANNRGGDGAGAASGGADTEGSRAGTVPALARPERGAGAGVGVDALADREDGFEWDVEGGVGASSQRQTGHEFCRPSQSMMQ